MKHPIWIFGVPRSGTSWLGQIFNSHPSVAFRFQPLFSYAFKDRLTNISTKQEIQSFYEEVFESSDDFVLQTRQMQEQKISFKKDSNPSHLVLKEVRYLHIVEHLLSESPNTKIVGIIRNPLSVLYSWMHAPKEFRSEWNINKEWQDATAKNEGKEENFYGFNRWKEVAMEFHRLQLKFKNRFQTVIYNNLLDNTVKETEKIFDFSDLNYSDQTNEFIRRSSTTNITDAYGVLRKGQRDDKWKKGLPSQIINTVRDELKDTELEMYL